MIRPAEHYRKIADVAIPSELSLAQWEVIHQCIEKAANAGRYCIGGTTDQEFGELLLSLNSRQLTSLKEVVTDHGFYYSQNFARLFIPASTAKVYPAIFISWEDLNV